MKTSEGEQFLMDWFMELTLGYGVPMDFIEKNYWNQPHRHYHTWEHVIDLGKQIYKYVSGREDHEYAGKCLILAAIYHDVVYDPKSSTNEEDSARLFNEQFGDHDKSVAPLVTQMILDTKTHVGTSELSEVFCQMDLDILYRPLSEQMVFENQIFKEYQFFDYQEYKTGRLRVLGELQEQNPHIDLEPLMEYVRGRVPKIGFYPGSFNPFHKGHLNILQKAEKLFDKVIIGHGINPEKVAIKEWESPDIYPPLPEVLKYHQVIQYKKMMHKLVEELPYPVTVIRGLRNGTDLQYELNQYRFIQELSKDKVDIISIFCDAKYEHISSSAIRHLTKYGQESTYLL